MGRGEKGKRQNKNGLCLRRREGKEGEEEKRTSGVAVEAGLRELRLNKERQETAKGKRQKAEGRRHGK